MRYKEINLIESVLKETSWHRAPLGYWDPKTKELYSGDGHYDARYEVFDSGDFPKFTNVVEKAKQEFIDSVGAKDEDDVRYNPDKYDLADDSYEKFVDDLISDNFPNHLVRVGDMDSIDGFIIDAEEKYAKMAAKYFLKRIIKNEWIISIDTEKGSYYWVMPMDRDKLVAWVSSSKKSNKPNGDSKTGEIGLVLNVDDY